MALGVGCVLAGRARARQVIGSASVGNGHGPNSGCPLRGASAAAAESCAVLLEEVSGQLSCTTGQDSTASCCWVDGRTQWQWQWQWHWPRLDLAWRAKMLRT